MLDREQLEQAIAAQEALRATLGDDIVDATIAVLKERLATIIAHSSEQRKLVTILFADTVSSTAMSEKLDPEDVLEIMDGALRLYTDAVSQLGGTVARLMGDGMLAFFGAPIGREDDPLRAVRCGLAITHLAQDYARTVEERWDVPGFNVRVGINTGLVALGEVGGNSGSEWTAMGDAINLASRLESAAPVGGVLISYDTYRHVRGVFETRTLDPIRVKGKADPIQVYVVEREKPRTFRSTTRGVEGIETHMVGRDDDLKRMQTAFNWAMDESETQVVTIVGEPGVGKSRLLREFDMWVDERPESVTHFTGRATVEMSNLPYALMRNVFAFRFDIWDSDSAATVREKLERGVAQFMGDGSERKAHYIGNLIGFDLSSSPYLEVDDPDQFIQLGTYYITEFFAAVAENPAVIFLDDIHWADDKSLDLINHIVRSRRGLKLLVVCIMRPTFFERRAPIWDERHEFHTAIELRPLSKDDSRQLVEQILWKVAEMDPDLQDLIVNTADGNPFYVEELIKMLMDDGVICKDPECWWINREKMTNIRIPPTLTGVLQARLDALPDVERTVLQRASAVGRIFWDSLIAAMHGEEDTSVENVREALAALERRDLIRWREKSAFEGTQEYIFKHTILKDVTYESVLRRMRRTYHAQIAEWLVERITDRASEYVGLIAEHYERAGQARMALTYLNKASEQALAISAYREAITLLEKALKVLEEFEIEDAKAQEGQIRLQLGQAHRGLSAYAEAKELYEQSLLLFVESQYNEGIVRALYELGWLVGYILRQFDDGEQYVQESLAIARSIGDKRGIAWALNGIGVMNHWQGRHAEAIRNYEESLAIAREIGDQARVSGALNNLGLVRGELGQYDEARRYLEESLALSQQLGRRSGLTSALNNLGGLARAQGRHEEARKLFTEAMTIQREIGDRSGVAIGMWSLGTLARIQGEYDEARRCFSESLTISREIGFPAGIGSSLEDLALVARLQGNYGESRRLLEESLKIAQDFNDQNEVANALLNLGAVARIQGKYDEARQFLEDSVVMNMDSGNRKGIARALFFLGDVSMGTRKIEEAGRYYQDALDIYREFDNRTGIVLALSGLGDVRAALGDYEGARGLLHDAFTLASTIRDTPLTLWILTGIASLLTKEGEKARALELLGLVLNHPATPQESRSKANAVLGDLRAGLKPNDYAAAMERGRAMATNGNEERRVMVDEDRWMTLLA